MTITTLFTKKDVCQRWQISARTLDRLRLSGKVAWLDVSGGRGSRPAVRFALDDIERFELSIKRGQPDAMQSEIG
jgi:hypothetical protein